LSDAPRLSGHIEDRLLFGLALKEEQEFLTGDGTAGSMVGINQEAAAFLGSAAGQTALDTLAKAANELAIGNYEPSGFVLHPTDWLNMKLLKDTTGRYLLGDPADMTMPQLWGLPVVPTVSQTLGNFAVLDARQLGEIADREAAPEDLESCPQPSAYLRPLSEQPEALRFRLRAIGNASAHSEHQTKCRKCYERDHSCVARFSLSL
jgi:hypothetical protein